MGYTIIGSAVVGFRGTLKSGKPRPFPPQNSVFEGVLKKQGIVKDCREEIDAIHQYI
jgi:hypothetical protein